MNKMEIDSESDILAWLAAPQPAVFQGQDLRPHTQAALKQPLTGCTFLGCEMEVDLLQAAVTAGCTVIRRPGQLAFDPFRAGLYSPEQLFDVFDPENPASYGQCLDAKVYHSCIDPVTKNERQVDVEEILMRRLHDASMSEALDDLLETRRTRTVAIMGGHDVSRKAPVYKQTVLLAHTLAQKGYLIATGGGPGLMEAANLGAYLAAFSNGVDKVDAVLEILANAPLYNDANWLKQAFIAKTLLGARPVGGDVLSLGIPTWFYGHEPPNVFATAIAKYFENSIREEGLLAIAWGGVIFAPGNGGTVQEIFQDACQNYYKTYGGKQSPMVLFGSEYWNPSGAAPAEYSDPKAKPVYSLLMKLADEKRFAEKILLTDDSGQIIEFIESQQV